MNYRRALLLADLRADPAAAVAVLRRVAPRVERICLVAGARSVASWWSSQAPHEAEARDAQALERWRAAAAAVATTDVREAPELPVAALVDLALSEDADLLVAGARAFDSAALLQAAARRLGVAVLWPAGPLRTTPVARLFCAATGERGRAAIAVFLREHAEPTLDITVAGRLPMSQEELGAALQVLGVQTRVELLPRVAWPLRGALAAAERAGPIDLVVLPRVHTLPLLRYDWPAPVLLVPAAAGPRARRVEMTDVVELGGMLHARVDGLAIASPPAADLPVAFVADGRVVANAMTDAFGELELPATVDAAWLGAVPVVDESPADPLIAAQQRVAVLRPRTTGRLLLFDCELPDARLRAVFDAARADALDPLAIRLRPTRRASEIRRRLHAAGLPSHVVDARTVLQEGDAHDVGERNDAVRLARVARRMRAAGFVIASLFDRSLARFEPPDEPPTMPIGGNRIEVELDNAQARRWLLDAIAQSRQSVSLQVYMATDDDVGRTVEAALAAAATRGVTVRVLVDSLHGLHGSFGSENPLLARLGAHRGVELRVSSPVTSVPSMTDLKVRDHRKIVLVDDRLALVGGRNLAHEYYTGFDEVRLAPSTNWRAVPWLDAGARIEGPAVAVIAAAFVEAWRDAGGAEFPVGMTPPVGTTDARVVVHRGLRDASTLDVYLELIARARSHLYVVNGFPYALELQHALVRAIGRGVRVRVLSGHLTPAHDGAPFPGPWSRARSTATELVHSRLDPIIEAGGEVYLFAQRDPMMGVVSMHVHAKVLCADGRHCAVGSANFDITSAYWESELMVVVEDEAVTAHVERRLDALLAGSTRVERDDPAWRERARRRQWMRRWPGVLGI